MAFLQQVSVRTRIYSGAEKFVDELHRRWTDAQQARRRHTAATRRRSASCRPSAKCRTTRSSSAMRARTSGRAEAEGGLRRRRHQDVVRSRAPGRRRRLRPQDPAQHRPLLVTSSRSSRPRPSAGSKAISAANGATRSTARATSRKARCSSCRCASTTRTTGKAQVPDKFKAVHFTRLPGRRTHAGIRAPPAGPAVVARRHEATSPQPAPPLDEPAATSAVDARAPVARASRRSPRRRAAYFYGREEEVAELARRVQRKLLTILFGQSGLGKTSILRAGIVPRLRPEGYCPVYVRIDYSPDSPAPSEQIKQAIFRATQAAGRGRSPAPRSPASRCGSSCTTATTSCATRPARRSSRC